MANSLQELGPRYEFRGLELGKCKLEIECGDVTVNIKLQRWTPLIANVVVVDSLISVILIPGLNHDHATVLKILINLEFKKE